MLELKRIQIKQLKQNHVYSKEPLRACKGLQALESRWIEDKDEAFIAITTLIAPAFRTQTGLRKQNKNVAFGKFLVTLRVTLLQNGISELPTATHLCGTEWSLAFQCLSIYHVLLLQLNESHH